MRIAQGAGGALDTDKVAPAVDLDAKRESPRGAANDGRDRVDALGAEGGVERGQHRFMVGCGQWVCRVTDHDRFWHGGGGIDQLAGPSS